MIQHVTLEVTRERAGEHLRFWAALGFAPVDPPPSLAERAAWVQRGPTQVHLLWTEDPIAPPKGHVAVVAEDFDATMDALRAAGFEPQPRARHWGVPRAYARGPEGHLVEVMAAPPA